MIPCGEARWIYNWNGGFDVKRRTWGILLTTAVLGLSGCGGAQLTEKQTSEAAEYMAGLILKYDKNYVDTIVYPEETVEPEVTVEPVSSSVPEKDVDKNTENMQGDAQNAGDTEGGSIAVSEGSFADVLGVSDIKVSFKEAYLTKEYKEKENSSYVVYPSSGEKLAIVRLSIKNTSTKAKKIFLTERGVEYKLKLSDGTSCSAEITAISNDLNFFNAKIKAGKKKTVVLVFSVPSSVKKVEGALSASAEESTATIAIK